MEEYKKEELREILLKTAELTMGLNKEVKFLGESIDILRNEMSGVKRQIEIAITHIKDLEEKQRKFSDKLKFWKKPKTITEDLKTICPTKEHFTFNDD